MLITNRRVKRTVFYKCRCAWLIRKPSWPHRCSSFQLDGGG